jgi:hypothetical protein
VPTSFAFDIVINVDHHESSKCSILIRGGP